MRSYKPETMDNYQWSDRLEGEKRTHAQLVVVDYLVANEVGCGSILVDFRLLFIR